MRRHLSVLSAAALVPTLALSLGGGPTASVAATAAVPAVAPAVAPAVTREPVPAKQALAVGRGGAVTSVDADASRIGLEVLQRGGNAVDAAVATAAALGVTEPYSAGVGGGGYLVHYDARTRQVQTIDGRETAPQGVTRDAFLDPATGEPYPFTPDLVTSGAAVGAPGTPATWRTALSRWGTWSLARVLEPSARLAERGFVVDDTFRSQTIDNKERFRAFRTTKGLFLRGGRFPQVGTRFTNPDLAATYRAFARDPLLFSRGDLPREIATAVRRPPVVEGANGLPVPPGTLTIGDQARYRVSVQEPSRTSYRGLEVVGMRPSSSGGTTVGEALNILERSDLGGLSEADYLHRYLEASALAFADRGAYVGDARFVDVPVTQLLDQQYADERACALDPDTAATKPVPAGDVTAYDGECGGGGARATSAEDNENISTTHLTTADRWGDVVSYTLTIEQTGGSGIVVPGRGFLLNNELTDFSLVHDADDPNRLQKGKRPRSSMSPTIVLRGGKPFLALGSPGGSTIITTVLQVLLNRLDRGDTLLEAVAEPRAAQRNTPSVSAEPGFIERYGSLLEPYGHDLVPSGDAFTSAAEIGAVTGIELSPDGLMTVVAEPTRRGGGSARVVTPDPG